MQQPLQITFRNLSHSDAIDSYVRDHVAKLDGQFPRITGCHVTIEAPHRHQHIGSPFRVGIDMAVPGSEIVINHAPDEDLAGRDLYAAIDQAFDQAGRRLDDFARRQRGEVKAHEHSYMEGRVAKLWTYEGYGFLTRADGSEVYFHANSVLKSAFNSLQIGSKVRFVEEMGDKGPQASTVILQG